MGVALYRAQPMLRLRGDVERFGKGCLREYGRLGPQPSDSCQDFFFLFREVEGGRKKLAFTRVQLYLTAVAIEFDRYAVRFGFSSPYLCVCVCVFSPLHSNVYRHQLLSLAHTFLEKD